MSIGSKIFRSCFFSVSHHTFKRLCIMPEGLETSFRRPTYAELFCRCGTFLQVRNFSAGAVVFCRCGTFLQMWRTEVGCEYVSDGIREVHDNTLKYFAVSIPLFDVFLRYEKWHFNLAGGRDNPGSLRVC